MSFSHNRSEARERFRQSLNGAQIADLLGLISGAETDLVNYDEVAKRLHARQQIELGTQMVPLDLIVGSVGRYRDFTRTFLPRAAISLERWTRVDEAMHSMTGLPPVDLFKIGEVYFVKDGNHRVSVAKANGMTHIEAYVTALKTDIPLTLDDFERDQWIIKIERKEFLEATRLDELRPDHAIQITEPGRYAIMFHHIEVHRYFRDLELNQNGNECELDWFDAVASWYDSVYLPVVEAIRDYDLLRSFPERTEADLYLWIVHHRERLAQEYELAPLSPSEAVSTFAEVYSDTLLQRTMKGLRFGLYRVFGQHEKPLGMSEMEFKALRERHEAGELSISEAEQRRIEAYLGIEHEMEDKIGHEVEQGSGEI
jgi:hypothetical protein